MAKIYQRIESYTDKPIITPNTPSDYMKRADRNASLNQITTYIYQSLLDYQGKWYSSSRGTNYIFMPYARYLCAGDKITNSTTGAVYLISEVINPPATEILPGVADGLICINSQGAVLPVEGDVLALEQRNTINFESSYSREIQNVPVVAWRDTIVYRVKRREPGTTGHHAFEPPSELRPRERELRADRDHPGSQIKVMGQWFDNIIQFDCWAIYNNRADNLIEWFEDFMFKYTWVWEKNGVNKILYWMRNEDEESSRWRNDLAVRNVSYYFRTEKLVTIKEYEFRQISVLLELGILASGVYNPAGQVQPSGFIQIQDQGLLSF